jgi:hypothetical protein
MKVLSSEWPEPATSNQPDPILHERWVVMVVVVVVVVVVASWMHGHRQVVM